MQERRKYPRMPLAVSLEIMTDDTKQMMGKGFITNLSEAGVAFETPKTLHAGEKLLFHFNLTQQISFDVNGEVIYSRDGILTKAYGAKFFNIDVETEDKFKNFFDIQLIRK